jgi:hypothetical protein
VTVYRKEIAFGGTEVLRDEHGWPPPGDPDGPWQKIANRLAAGHRAQDFWGWEYKATPSKPSKPPAGDGWELNGYAGDGGYEVFRDGSGQERQVTYWRRRKP